MNPPNAMSAADQSRLSRVQRYFPLLIAQGYLWGTFVLFWFTPDSGEVENAATLIVFICCAYFLFAVGYVLYERRWNGNEHVQSVPCQFTRVLLVLSLCHLLLLAWSIRSEMGSWGIGELLTAIADPGAAYKQKFDIYLENETRSNSRLGQLVTVAYVLYYVSVPLAIRYWSFIGWPSRLLTAVAGAAYAVAFLAVGTLKGLGDLLIMSLVGYAAWACSSRQHPQVVSGSQTQRRLFQALVVMLIAMFCSYMALNLSSRMEAFGGVEREKERLRNSALSKVLPDAVAVAVGAVASYPTHGYCGLAFNLDTPFEWTYGRGNSRALDSYLSQYAGSPSVLNKTFPLRTEDATGWPALSSWCTIFPWLASDLTFPGAVVFMTVIGWLLAYAWRSALRGEPFGICVLCQLVILIAFVPANNQLLIGRTGLWGIVGTLVWGLLRLLSPPSTRQHVATPTRPAVAMR